ncbi:uncharacterized protein [Misgurnus anguillicaudatus]|uniref:uncharacterized protein isoform X2 n=1 Tax=Misgurnus anguillicaudatus TaxID=75329 RepID=UPI003CCF53DC
MLQVEGEQAEGEAPKEEEEEPQDCGSEACRRRRLRHKRQVADLNAQIDTLSSTLQEVTRRCKKLLRQFGQKPSQRLRGVKKKLLEALQEPEEEQAPLSPPSAFAVGTPGPSSAAPEVPEVEESEMPHFPDHVSALNDFLEEYRKHQEGPNPSRKLKENVGGKIYRIRAFIAFMAAGKSRLSSLEFLKDTEKIWKWVSSLKATKAAETTVGHYLKNVAQFLDYVSETPPSSSRLSYKAMLAIRREVRGLIRGMRRGVTMHQIGVKQAKEGQLIPKKVLRKCRAECQKLIPGILDQLEEDLSQKTQFVLYGHLTAYFASIYGHRLGVFQNMTIKEVEKAVKSDSTGSYLINISLHKTNQAFGPAQLSLKKEEYHWFRRFLALREHLVGGPEAVYFCYTSTPNPCKNLNNYFQGAWVSMGLPGKPTFTDIRTSIATHARNTHNSDNRQKVAKFMCHDTSTAGCSRRRWWGWRCRRLSRPRSSSH